MRVFRDEDDGVLHQLAGSGDRISRFAVDDLPEPDLDVSVSRCVVERLGGQISLPSEVRLDGGEPRIRVLAEERIVVDAQYADFLRNLDARFAANVDYLVGTVVTGSQDAAGLWKGPEPVYEGVAIFRAVRKMADVEHPSDEAGFLQRIAECAATLMTPVRICPVASISVASVYALSE